jgi:hypothetical protein
MPTDTFTQTPPTADYALRSGDTNPAIEATLKDLDGSTVDLSNANDVRILIRRRSDGADIVDSPATIDDAANGEVSKEFPEGFPSNQTGMHFGYFRVHFPNGVSETYPRAGSFYLFVPDTFEDGYIADADIGVLRADDVIADKGEITQVETAELTGGVTNNTLLELINGPGLTIDADGRLAVTGDVDRLTTDEIYGDVTNFSVLDLLQGPGLTIDSNGRLAVTAEIADNIDGLTNPLVEALNADGYDINNAGIIDAQGLRSDLQEITSTSDLSDGEAGFYYVANDDDVIWFDGDTSTN